MELAARDGSETETPLQKFERLNCEVRELQQELQDLAVAKDKTSGGGDDKKTSELLHVAKKVGNLQEELSTIKLEETLGTQVLKVRKNLTLYLL